MNFIRFRTLFAYSCFAILAAPVALLAQPATGSISGRVFNTTNGSYVSTAHVVVTGTPLEAFTDITGTYRIDAVPVGAVTVTVSYTGLAEKKASVTLTPGNVTVQDFNLTGFGESGDQTVRLDSFVVQAQKDTDQKSIAINEQRYAVEQKSVVSADQFGDVPDGNIGEFLKYMPGVSLEYTAADARQIILQGINPVYTSVMIDGSPMASAASSTQNRYFELEQVSVNNAARVEVSFSRTPDMPASALGGSVNLVSRNAFETAAPRFDYRAYFNINSDYRQWGATPGLGRDITRKIRPSFDFRYVNPVSKRFGFTLSYTNSDVFNGQHYAYDYWTPYGGGNSASTGGASTIANPFNRQFQWADGPKDTKRQSVATTLDFKLSSSDTFSVRTQYNVYSGIFNNRFGYANVQGTSGTTVPIAWGSDYTHGGIGAGYVELQNNFLHKYGTTYQIDTLYRHRGSIWTLEAGASYSVASNHYHDAPDGHFNSGLYYLPAVTVNLDGFSGSHDYFKPSSITALSKTTGLPVDWTKLSNYYLSQVQSTPSDSQDLLKSAHAEAKRDVALSWMQTTVMVGASVKEQVRDIRRPYSYYNFVGPNKTVYSATNPDPGLSAGNYDLADANYASERPAWNLPAIQYPDAYKAYALFQAHPEYFQYQSGNIATDAKNSAYLTEVVPAAFLRGDSRLFNSRLRLTYGIRFEKTLDHGYGYLFDPNAMYQKDSSGNIAIGSNGKGVVLNGPNGLPLTDASNAILLAQMEYKDRGTHATNSYANGYPSMAATYEIRPNLLARLAYTKALGRPNFGNIIPGVNLPDPTANPPYNITLNNAKLSPEQSDNFNASLEYYFATTGMVGIAAYRKDISNFFGSSTVPATADLLNTLQVPAPSLFLGNGSTVTSTFNSGTARVTGLQLDYKQALTFLPVPGFGVFASGYATHLTGSPYADFTNFISRAGSAGISYSQRRFGVKINFNHRGVQRYGMATYTDASGQSEVVYPYWKARNQFDINIDVRLTKNVGLFLMGRNITNVLQQEEIYGPNTPTYARQQQTLELGAQYSVGLKGTF